MVYFIIYKLYLVERVTWKILFAILKWKTGDIKKKKNT